MIDDLLSLVAPHLCYGCGKIGTLLCDNCKYNISSEYNTSCLACGRPATTCGVCVSCQVPYSQGWCVGQRVDVLQKLIDGYKFEYVRSAYRPLAELLVSCVGQVPANTVVVPIPTIPSHIRQRGYDHTYLIACYFARKRRLVVRPLLRRTTNTTQRDSARAVRHAQAQQAFTVGGHLDSSTPYLLIDDIVTTGFTVHYAAQALKEAGAREVWAAAIARQPLD